MDSTEEHKPFVIHTDLLGGRYVEIDGRLISLHMAEMFYKKCKETDIYGKNFSSCGYAE